VYPRRSCKSRAIQVPGGSTSRIIRHRDRGAEMVIPDFHHTGAYAAEFQDSRCGLTAYRKKMFPGTLFSFGSTISILDPAAIDQAGTFPYKNHVSAVRRWKSGQENVTSSIVSTVSRLLSHPRNLQQTGPCGEGSFRKTPPVRIHEVQSDQSGGRIAETAA
jgi:hypothetical protein